MCLHPTSIVHKGKLISVDCGKCVDCRRQRALAWAYRIVLEARQHSQNCMITLTYNDANLPDGASLLLQDLQKFIKRLRKKFGKLRYFACGEYGEKGMRPHYHLIVFGFCPSDLVYFFTDKKGVKLYRSADIEKLWTLGFSTVGEVTLDTAKYCAIYLQKAPRDGVKKPFVVMSRRPGIGLDGFEEKWLASDKIYVDGKYISIPRYYLDKCDERGIDTTAVRDKRFARAVHFSLNAEEQFEETKRRRKKFETFFKNSLDNDGRL